MVEGWLLAALRVLLANDGKAVEKHDLETLKSFSAEAPLGVANEVAAFCTMIALCVIALGHFPMKIMEDESLLANDTSRHLGFLLPKSGFGFCFCFFFLILEKQYY